MSNAQTESIAIAPRALDAMVAHARREAPNECCGLLIGSPGRIDESIATANLAASQSRFLIDPSEHIAINRRLRGSSRDIVGAYHSHPHSLAEPSPTDIAEAHYPEFIHVIVSLADPSNADVRGYRIRNGRVSSVTLTLRSFRST
jgi:[CysO sulfur-carrier protein]-S-L-cysteine hydrolase